MFLKAVNLFLILFLSLSNLVTICPEKKGATGEIHLAFDSCDFHECHRNEASSTCNKEICDHQFCNDRPVFDEFHIPQQNRFTSIFSVFQPITHTHFALIQPVAVKTVHTSTPPHSLSIPDLTTVLRI
jgi:hypothetical protein